MDAARMRQTNPDFVKVVEAVRRALRRSKHLDLHDVAHYRGGSTGGHAGEIGHTAFGDLAIDIWCDRYLHPEGEPRYSSWLYSPSRRLIAEAAAESTWSDGGIVRDNQRTKRAPYAIAEAPGASWLGKGFIDRWSDGDYFGRYPRAAKGNVVAALVRDIETLARLCREPTDKQVMKPIWERRGQPGFRKRLMRHFGGTCAISRCAVPALLEAAHIVPYRRGGRYDATNGILLRADLHTLFDVGLLTVSADRRAHFHGAAGDDPGYRKYERVIVRRLGPKHLASLADRAKS